MSNTEIKDFRQRFGLTREDLASKLGVSATTIWRWEISGKKPHNKVLKSKLSQIINRYQEKGEK